jgi:hypothetical protein
MGFRIGRRLVPQSTMRDRMDRKDRRIQAEMRRQTFIACTHRETHATDPAYRECRRAKNHTGAHDYGFWTYPQESK